MSTLNPDNMPEPGDDERDEIEESLGPSDTSDSGSDLRGARRHEFDKDSELDNHALETGGAGSDSTGTGERASADGDEGLETNADIETDHLERPFVADDEDEAGTADDGPDDGSSGELGRGSPRGGV